MKPHIKVIQRNGVDIFVTSTSAISQTSYNRFNSPAVSYNAKIRAERQRKTRGVLLK